MDIHAVYSGLKKVAKVFFSLILIFSLSSCPGEDTDCFDLGSIADVPNLIELSPEEVTYNVADELVFKWEIPATTSYYGAEMNLHAATGDNSARLVLNFDQLFIDNELTFLTGSQGEYPNWFNMPYNTLTDTYELEFVVKFFRTGFYSFTGNGSVEVQGNDYCNRFRIDTNVIWTYNNGFIEFTVIE